MKLQDASKFYVGGSAVSAVYAGVNKVWPSGPLLWTPAQIPGDLAMWLQADTLTGADLSRIDTWADSGPDGRTFTRVQTTGPQINVARLNGKKTLLFDTRSMACAALQFTDFAVYVVWFKFSGGATQRLIDHNYTTGFWIGRHNSISGRLACGIKQTVAPYADDIAADYTNWHISTVSRVGSTKRIRNNGGVAEGTFAAVNTITSSAIVTVGGITGAISPDLNIAEVVILDQNVETNMEKIEGYLAHKWGLQANLKVGHPYKDTAPSEAAVFDGMLSDADRAIVTTHLMTKWGIT